MEASNIEEVSFVSQIDIGWTAGIIDGEGSVIAGPRPKQKGRISVGWYTRVSVANTDIRMLEKLKSLWGGYISGAKVNRPDRCLDIYAWSINHKKVIPFLEQIEPHLIVKRKQAELVLELQRRISAKNWISIIDAKTGRASGRMLPIEEVETRKEIFIKLKALNRRGGYHGRNSTKSETLSESVNKIHFGRDQKCLG